jgi:peroxiredoxin
MKQLRIGDEAPDFTLTDHNGELFNLGTRLHAGPVILVFYTLDGSPTCTTFLCAINKDVDEFARHKLQIVGINYADSDSHNQMAQSKFLRLPLLTDSQYQVARIYSSLYEIGPIKAIRYSVVGIGRDGRIQYMQRGKPTNAQILEGMGIEGANKPTYVS